MRLEAAITSDIKRFWKKKSHKEVREFWKVFPVVTLLERSSVSERSFNQSVILEQIQ